ncbi:MAG TPA: multicopper oxidase domain-containing protein [Bryobacteraceae bacterium]|nr:multicopper oxidase domain-containing protein [Bryobacteraceae bacterium]
MSSALLRASAQSSSPAARTSDADITLHIGETTAELAPGRLVRTLAYNGQVPGPLLRATEGKSIAVDIWNDTREPQMVHWHGLHIPSDVDGAHEEGTPHVPANERRRLVFTPRPAGTRWYHAHGPAGKNLHKTTYSGQFGMLIVDPRDDAGRYDQEVPIILHEWEGYFTDDGDVDYKLFSINGKMLGAGEPIGVRRSQRVLFRFLNASATLSHRLALPGHKFNVIALDGNTLATPRSVPILDIAPAERVDAFVEMDQPGIWILGELLETQRRAGLGIVLEYAGERGAPRWISPAPFTWDYTFFGAGFGAAVDPAAAVPEPDGRFPLVIKAGSGHQWTLNGKSFPHTDTLMVKANRRYRLIFDNQSAEAHPLHLHRHTFEITKVAGKPAAGVFKDTVVVPPWKQVEVDVIASNPGPTLMHCHQQLHMDMGFMMMMQYSG